MTPAEAVMLCRYVKATCPQQAFDEYTPDAWFDLLGDLPYPIAKRAARDVAQRQPFVSPSEIIATTAEMRSRMWDAITGKRPPLADWDGISDWDDYRRQRLDALHAQVDEALAAGRTPADYPLVAELPDRPIPAAAEIARALPTLP